MPGALLIAAGCLGADTFHVSPAGNDAGSGSIARPWRTIGKAARVMGPGDTVMIGDGTYAERVRLERSGAAGRPITFRAESGARPVIDGAGIPLVKDEGLFEIMGVSHIRVRDLSLMNAAEAGFLAERAQDLVIQGCRTERTGSSGIGVWWCRDVRVEGNEVALSCAGAWQEAVSIAGTAGFEVGDNLVHNGPPGHRKEGICVKHGSSDGRVYGNRVHHVRGAGIYVDAWDTHTHGIQVYANEVRDVWEGNGIALASEMGGLLEGVRVFNNVSWRNRWVGICITRNGEKVPHPMRDIWVVNNTVWGNGTQEWGGGILADDPDCASAVIRNNISAGNLTFEIAVAEGPEAAYAVDHNLSFGQHDEPATRLGGAAIVADPRFTDPNAGDFTLMPGSPAVDRGSVEGAPAVDFAGTARPRGAGVDIGAYER